MFDFLLATAFCFLSTLKVLPATIFGFLSALIFCFLLVLIILLAILFYFLLALVLHFLLVFLFTLDYFIRFISNTKDLIDYLINPRLSRLSYLHRAS